MASSTRTVVQLLREWARNADAALAAGAQANAARAVAADRYRATERGEALAALDACARRRQVPIPRRVTG